MRDFFTVHKKLLLVLGILFLLVTIPLTIFIVQQRQNLQQEASIIKPSGNTDACGLIQVDVAENPSCPNLSSVSNGQIVPTDPTAKNDTSTYTTTYTLKNIDAQKHTVSYARQSYYCTSAYGQAGKDNVSGVEYAYCNDDPKIETINVEIEPGAAIPVIIQRSAANNVACGSFQTDFTIKSVDGNSSCLYQGSQPGQPDSNSAGATGFCQTGIACLAPTATPTLTVAPTITPTPTRIATPSATPTRTASSSATPSPTTFVMTTSTPSATPSATPTGTLTPTPTATTSGTLTPTMTIALTDTPTPTLLVQVTPTPTLPVTGNPLLTTLVGLGGMILVILGGVAFFIL